MTISIDRFVNSTITRATRTVSQRAFSVALIAAYHALYADRVREYEDPSDMLTDGFTSTHPAYLAAVALCSQSPRPTSFKVGRRVGAPAQVIRLTPATPAASEVFSFTVGGVTFSVTADSSPTAAEITAAFATLVAANATAVAATPVHTAATEVDLTAFDGSMGGTLNPPRNVTLVLNSHADWDATTGTVTGLDKDGRPQTESFTIPNGGNTTLVGTKVFSKVTQVTIPPQSGTNGTLTVGVGVKFANAALAFTATDNTGTIDIASTGTGAWFAYTAVSANLSIQDRTTEPGTTLATDLAAIQAADPNFLGLIVADAQSAAQIEAAAAWAETQQVVYEAHSMDSDVEGAVSSDVASVLLAAGRVHTEVFYSRVNHGKFPDAALLGSMLGGLFRPGDKKIVSFRQLSGISPDALSATVVTRLIGTPSSPLNGKRVAIYGDVAPTGANVGTACTLGGLTAGGEWLDVVIGLYFVDSLLKADAFARMLAGPVTFTAKGVAAFEATVRRSLQKCAAAPYSILDPDSITTQATALADVSDSDRQARHYDGVRWDARTQGAIQALDVGGTVAP